MILKDKQNPLISKNGSKILYFPLSENDDVSNKKYKTDEKHYWTWEKN
jgi:hypothetical protein